MLPIIYNSSIYFPLPWSLVLEIELQYLDSHMFHRQTFQKESAEAEKFPLHANPAMTISVSLPST